MDYSEKADLPIFSAMILLPGTLMYLKRQGFINGWGIPECVYGVMKT